MPAIATSATGTTAYQGPKTLFQLLVHLLRQMVKSLKWRLLFAVLTFIIVFIVHTYLMVVVNDTIRIVEQNRWLAMILNLVKTGLSERAAAGQSFNSLLFWMLLSTVAFGTVSRLISFGFKQFFKDLGTMMDQLFHLRVQGSNGKSVPYTLVGFSLAMLAGIFVLNNAACLMLAIFLFLSVSQRERSFLILVLTLGKSDLQRLFRVKKRKIFNIDVFAVFVWGLILGLLLSGLIPPVIFGKTMVSTVVKILIFLAIVVITSLNQAKKKTAAKVILFLSLAAGLVVLKKMNVWADDSGWSESGRNIRGWLANSGTPTALILSLSPALLSSLANVLGPMFPNFMLGLIKNPNMNPYEYIRNNLTPEQFAEVRALTEQRHQQSVEQLLAENSNTNFIKDFLSGVYNDVTELAQAYADFRHTLEVELPQYLAENPLEALNNSWQFVRGVGGAVGDLASEGINILRDLARDPVILLATMEMTASDLVNDPIGSGQKVVSTLYEMSGLQDIVNCMDPNKSATERAGLYAMGVIKMYGLIDGAGTVADTSRAALNRLSTYADDLIRAAGGTPGGAVRSADDLIRLHAGLQRTAAGQQIADDFVRAVRSGGSEDDIMQRILNIQQDRSSIRALNELARNSDEAAAAVQQYNRQLQSLFDKVDREVREELATRLACSSDDLQVVAATNRSGQIKIGFDRDVTIRLNGRDIKPSQWDDLYRQRLYENSRAYFPDSMTPDDVIQRLDHALTDKFHPEAYGANERALDLAINRQAHMIADAEQVGNAITYKGMKHFDEAAKFRTLDPLRFEDEISEGMRQLTKQWDNQVMPAAQHFNASVQSSRLNQAIDIMKNVNNGVPTVEIERALQAIGYTKEQVALDLGKQFETIVKLGRQIP